MMTVRLDKDRTPTRPTTWGITAVRPEQVQTPEPAAPTPVSLAKPATRGGTTAPVPTPPPASDDTPSGSPDRSETAEPVLPRRRTSRLALTAAFILGAMVAGAIGDAVISSRSSDLAQTRNQLTDAHASVTRLRGQLNQANSQLASTNSQLASTNSLLTTAKSQAAEVAARASNLTAQQAQLQQRSAALDKREKAVAARETAVRAREAALANPNPGHPLLDSITGDGTWVVGRDIKPGTWTADASDTGCTWRTSDGRSGAGDGSYNQMSVNLQTGQSFTVHGCSLWGNYGF